MLATVVIAKRGQKGRGSVKHRFTAKRQAKGSEVCQAAADRLEGPSCQKVKDVPDKEEPGVLGSCTVAYQYFAHMCRGFVGLDTPLTPPSSHREVTSTSSTSMQQRESTCIPQWTTF